MSMPINTVSVLVSVSFYRQEMECESLATVDSEKAILKFASLSIITQAESARRCF